jgi:hypothetical protein
LSKLSGNCSEDGGRVQGPGGTRAALALTDLKCKQNIVATIQKELEPMKYENEVLQCQTQAAQAQVQKADDHVVSEKNSGLLAKLHTHTAPKK